jgi:hypothetical protein
MRRLNKKAQEAHKTDSCDKGNLVMIIAVVD